MSVGRRRPYTVAGIGRLRCSRCGAQASQQWAVCAINCHYLPVCTRCDIALNALALAFMRVPGATRLVDAYRRRMLG